MKMTIQAIASFLEGKGKIQKRGRYEETWDLCSVQDIGKTTNLQRILTEIVYGDEFRRKPELKEIPHTAETLPFPLRVRMKCWGDETYVLISNVYKAHVLINGDTVTYGELMRDWESPDHKLYQEVE